MGRGAIVGGVLVLVLLVVAVAVVLPRAAARPPGTAPSAATQTAAAQPEEAQAYPTVPTPPTGPTAQAAQAAVPAGAHPCAGRLLHPGLDTGTFAPGLPEDHFGWSKRPAQDEVVPAEQVDMPVAEG